VNRTVLLLGIALAAVLGAATLGGAGPRPAEDIIRDFDKVRYPGFVENISLDEYRKLQLPAAERQCRLALELHEDHPDHEEVPRLMGMRWTLTVNSLRQPRQAIRETEEILAKGPKRLHAVAATRRAYAGLEDPETPVADRFRYVRAALKIGPSDDRWGAKLLYRLAFENTASPAKQRQLYRLAVDRFGAQAEQTMGSSVKMLDRIGQRVELEFDDLLTGQRTRLAPDRPTVIFVWSPTARSESDIVDLKRATGVDVICIYFGSPSEAWARESATRHGIPWPLYYDGRELDDQWIRQFGVRFGRTFLLIDRDGKLAAATHRARPLLASLER